MSDDFLRHALVPPFGPLVSILKTFGNYNKALSRKLPLQETVNQMRVSGITDLKRYLDRVWDKK